VEGEDGSSVMKSSSRVRARERRATRGLRVGLGAIGLGLGC
jgi:hypothetical protein